MPLYSSNHIIAKHRPIESPFQARPGVITQTIFGSIPNLMQIVIAIVWIKTDLMSTKFCTYQDSWAVLVCAKFVYDQINKIEDINKHISIKFKNLHEISLVRQAPGYWLWWFSRSGVTDDMYSARDPWPRLAIHNGYPYRTKTWFRIHPIFHQKLLRNSPLKIYWSAELSIIPFMERHTFVISDNYP